MIILMKKRKKKDLDIFIKNLETFLSSKLKNGLFPLENYYGEIFFAGATQDKIIKEDILRSYLQRDKTNIDFHWEFNNYILQQLKLNDKIFKTYYFNRPFYKKVTNWIFLRSLIFLKSKNQILKLKGHLLILLTLLINQRNGILYDNRLYKNKEFSHQYHAFATVVLCEIFIETGNQFYKKRLESAIRELKKMCISIKHFNDRGRGSKQIFGYSSAIYALTLGKHLFGIDSEKEINLLTKEFLKYQRKDGSIPLCLDKKEFEFTEKDYKNKINKINGWESYNRYYDYVSFSYYFLKKSLKFLN